MELCGKLMRRSTIINLICKNMENLVVLSERGNRSAIFFSDSNIVTLNIIKDDYADDNLEAALDVVTTHIRKECSEMEYKNWTYSTKIAKDITEESATDTFELFKRSSAVASTITDDNPSQWKDLFQS